MLAQHISEGLALYSYRSLQAERPNSSRAKR